MKKLECAISPIIDCGLKELGFVVNRSLSRNVINQDTTYTFRDPHFKLTQDAEICPVKESSLNYIMLGYDIRLDKDQIFIISKSNIGKSYHFYLNKHSYFQTPQITVVPYAYLNNYIISVNETGNLLITLHAYICYSKTETRISFDIIDIVETFIEECKRLMPDEDSPIIDDITEDVLTILIAKHFNFDTSK